MLTGYFFFFFDLDFKTRRIVTPFVLCQIHITQVCLVDSPIVMNDMRPSVLQIRRGRKMI